MSRQRAIIRHLSASLLLAVSTGCYTTGPAGDGAVDGEQFAPAPRCIAAEDADRLADQVLQLVNLERAAADEGLAPVVVNSTLAKIAEEYACRMAEEGFFGHTDPINGHGPGERAVAGKYSYYSIGENLAIGPDCAAEVVKEWMASPSHRDIILGPGWTEVGIAVRGGSDDSIYWVQEFGDPVDY